MKDTTFKKSLARKIRNRCTRELQKARDANSVDEDFFALLGKVRQSIPMCFTGDHSLCRFSFVCTKKRRNSTVLKLTKKDKKTFQSIIDYRLSSEKLQGQRTLLTTNKVEAFHNRTLRLSPKDKLYKATYPGCCANAVIGDCKGIEMGILHTGEMMGLSFSETVSTKSNNLAVNRKNHITRKQTLKAKVSRHIIRQHKWNLRGKKELNEFVN